MGRRSRKGAADVLETLGLSASGDFNDPVVHAECIRIARRLRLTERRVVGLVPTSSRVAIPPIGVRLGLAQIQLSGSTVAYVDANVWLPAMASVASRPSTDVADLHTSDYSTRWLFESLALITPPAAAGAGHVIPQLARVIEEGTDLFHYMYVDLTGFDLIGEHAEASSLMDGVMAVGRAGETRDAELLHYRDEIRTSNFLGVLLTGGDRFDP